MAPEAFDASNYIITHKADIYALGVILWEMLTGSVPWEGCSMVAIAYSITVRHHRLPLSKLDAARCPPKLRKLIHQVSPALIKGGGVYLNNAKVAEELYAVKASDLIDGRLLLVAAGKKNKMLVRIAAE
ncbi:putative tyrosine-protein kinase [Tetrabaena socialis]|uniref:Putative tyrosine-protein kinase n=1 Tax=Tetrabaena socialis TaxID=47790 RepID=A0A2J7ZT85_9CHLO|nr:putative tyrosine-protein kinase [Tetrabaena socialis]|eukprot:PNH03479.1 putative tyrosine-protein kinase [Tetrabaena socialis]